VIKTFYNQEKFSFKAFKNSLWTSLREEALSYVFWTHALIGLCFIFWIDDKVTLLTRYIFFLIDASILIIPIFLLWHLYFYLSTSRDYKFVSFKESQLLFHPYRFTFRKALNIDYKSIQYIQYFPNSQYTYVIFEQPKGEKDETATQLIPIQFWREFAKSQSLLLVIYPEAGKGFWLGIEKGFESEATKITQSEFDFFVIQHPELELMGKTTFENYSKKVIALEDYPTHIQYKFELNDNSYGYLSFIDGKINIQVPHKKYLHLVEGFAQELNAEYSFLGKL